MIRVLDRATIGTTEPSRTLKFGQIAPHRLRGDVQFFSDLNHAQRRISLQRRENIVLADAFTRLLHAHLADLPMPDVTELQICAFRGNKTTSELPDIPQKYVA